MALTEQARFQYAVPAEEATKQAAEATKREKVATYRHFVTAVAVALAIGGACYNEKAGPWLAGIVAVLGGWVVLTKYLDKK